MVVQEKVLLPYVAHHHQNSSAVLVYACVLRNLKHAHLVSEIPSTILLFIRVLVNVSSFR